MLKFHSRGSGGGKGPTAYLTGTHGTVDGRMPSKAEQKAGIGLRSVAPAVLRGDPEQICELIDSSRYARTYTSGVLSFEEADLPEAQKQALMDSFEAALLPGMQPGQFSVLWVEHRDKGRLELNFVIPNLELTSGKRLQPYYHGADGRRMAAWQNLQNAELGLSDPNDPLRAQTYAAPRDLPAATRVNAEAITRALTSLAEAGEVVCRGDVIEKLTGAGFTVTRETKSSISIADPEGGRAVRLKGAIYERDFSLSTDLREERERASQRYHASRGERIEAARSELDRAVEFKRAELEKRHPAPQPDQYQGNTQNVGDARPEYRLGTGRQLRGPLVDGPASGREHRPDRAAEGSNGEGQRPWHPVPEREWRADHRIAAGLPAGNRLEGQWPPSYQATAREVEHERATPRAEEAAQAAPEVRSSSAALDEDHWLPRREGHSLRDLPASPVADRRIETDRAKQRGTLAASERVLQDNARIHRAPPVGVQRESVDADPDRKSLIEQLAAFAERAGRAARELAERVRELAGGAASAAQHLRQLEGYVLEHAGRESSLAAAGRGLAAAGSDLDWCNRAIDWQLRQLDRERALQQEQAEAPPVERGPRMR